MKIKIITNCLVLFKVKIIEVWQYTKVFLRSIKTNSHHSQSDGWLWSSLFDETNYLRYGAQIFNFFSALMAEEYHSSTFWIVLFEMSKVFIQSIIHWP